MHTFKYTCFCNFADAFVGGVIGLLFAYICYRQHYPPFLHMDCHLPYASLAAAAHPPSHPQDDPQPTDNATTLPLEGLTEGPVWLVATVETPPNTVTKPPSPPPHSQWLTGVSYTVHSSGQKYTSPSPYCCTQSRRHLRTFLFCFFFYMWFLLSSRESLYLDVMYERNLQIWDITTEREKYGKRKITWWNKSH